MATWETYGVDTNDFAIGLFNLLQLSMGRINKGSGVYEG